MMQPRLYRSRTQRMIAGICGGLAEYLVVDPIMVRMVFGGLLLLNWLILPLYLVLWLITPLAPITPITPITPAAPHTPPAPEPTLPRTTRTPSPPNPPLVAHHERRRNWRTLGYVLVGSGGLIVIEQLGSAAVTGLAPLLLVVSGVILVLRQRL
ncbi:MAG: PspC domain-containing protein [Chloroflexaceae bacterium]|nr:PspC domain-containing protein [Chloroflexaceae bacterium]